MRHIVWDWNGTLFDDVGAVMGATREVFAGTPAAGLTTEEFRAAYTRPIWVTYEQILGRALAEGEWERMDATFHTGYHRLMVDSVLTSDAHDALGRWSGSQSLLSMWGHDLLLPKVKEFGIAEFFTHVDGLRGAPGGGKAEHLVLHARAVGLDPGDITLIGDSVDDARAAAHIGAGAVLYTGGMQRRQELETMGVPVVDTLLEALELAQ
ncbi:MAG: HAD hydrolase-like protein [Streptosporangiaceae bacterium]